MQYDQNFLQRLPKIKIQENQIQNLDDYTLNILKKFLQSRLRKYTKKDQKSIEGFIEKIDFKDTDKNILETIQKFVNPQKPENQYQIKDKEKYILRAEQRASQFLEIFPEVKNLKVMADIGAGDGVISKVIAQKIGIKELDIYEPFVPEYKDFQPEDMKINFINHPFENVTKKYDIIFLITALHHIQNPQTIINNIYKSLNTGGYLLIREHQPINDQQKMFLDICEKLFAISLTGEENYDNIENHPMESYFTKSQLHQILKGFNLIKQKPEENYQVNGFINYFVFQKKDTRMSEEFKKNLVVENPYSMRDFKDKNKLKKYLIKTLRKESTYSIEKIENYVEGIDFEKSDKEIVDEINKFIKKEFSIETFIEKADMIYKEFTELKKNIQVDSMADIGGGNGIVSKTLAVKLKVKSLDIYEPYTKEIKGIQTVPKTRYIRGFYEGKKYDIIFLLMSLHHITYLPKLNAEYVFIWDHTPKDKEQLEFLCIQEKVFNDDVQNPEQAEESEEIAYFSTDNIKEIMKKQGYKLLSSKKTEDYEYNAFASYFIFQRI